MQPDCEAEPRSRKLDRPQLADERVLVGELPGLVLRVDELAVDVDVEDAAGTLDEKRLRAECVLDLGSQTDRYGLVASGGAVGDRDVHGGWSPWA